VPSAFAATSQRKLVLIVDDDDDAREVLCEFIGVLGHDALQAASAEEALARATAAKVDVALIDLGLPGTDGFEVARRIRGSIAGARIRLVALTGYSDESSRQSAVEAGFDEFLVKPALSDAIAAVVMGESPHR
jgi:CheY-like chemotaxis protein